MSETITLHAAPRSVTGKKVSRLRREGKTPIVVYGPRTEPVALQADTKSLIKALSDAGSARPIQLVVEGEAAPRTVHARELQQHVTRLTPLHADFVQAAD